MGRTDGTVNKVIETINGVPVILYGHFKKQYRVRVNEIFNITKNKDYMYTHILDRVKYIIKKNFNHIILKSGGGVERRTIIYQLPINYRGRKMVIETAVLLTSSNATFRDKENKIVSKAYVESVEKGIIKINEPVICIETVITAIRFSDEGRIAYTNLKCTEIITEKEVTINRSEFKLLNKDIIKYKSMMSYGVQRFQNIV